MLKGVTKAHMARRLGVAPSYMTKLEQGRLQPSGEMMFRMAKYLGQTIEVLFQHVPDSMKTFPVVRVGGREFVSQSDAKQQPLKNQ